MRYFIHLAYKGTNFHGWQSQPNAKSVQETIELALKLILKKTIEIVGAGRTDTGVHAREMYAHFDFDEKFDIEKIIYKLNSLLPTDIVIYNIIQVTDNAHARFDATARTYKYYINSIKSPFYNEISWYYSLPLSIEKMNDACVILKEYHDFECFSKSNTDVATFLCEIKEAFWVENENQLIFTITADRFLRNMVRAIVGTMVNVGVGKINPEDIRKIIESKNRSNAGFSVPAHGLFLEKICYPYISK